VSQQLILDFGAPPAPTLDNFVVGENAALLAMLKRMSSPNDSPHDFSNAIDLEYRFIYLWGDSGVGKSHLLRALARPQGTHSLIRTLDDVDRLDSAGQQAAFTQWIETQSAPKRALVIAGRWPPRDLKLREDLRTRIGSALVFKVQPPADADKLAALQAASWHRGFRLPDEIAQKLLDLLPRDLGSLGAAIAALDRFSLERKRAITLPLLREWLQHEVR
jgi:DnaA family protein